MKPMFSAALQLKDVLVVKKRRKEFKGIGYSYKKKMILKIQIAREVKKHKNKKNDKIE